MPLESSLAHALSRALSGVAGLRAAWLFGSTATGRAHAASDVDVAIVPEHPLALGAELALQADLERATGRPVDLVRLDLADPLVRWEVARTGVVLLSRDGAASRLTAEIALEHADLAPLVEQGAERWRRARLARP